MLKWNMAKSKEHLKRYLNELEYRDIYNNRLLAIYKLHDKYSGSALLQDKIHPQEKTGGAVRLLTRGIDRDDVISIVIISVIAVIIWRLL